MNVAPPLAQIHQTTNQPTNPSVATDQQPNVATGVAHVPRTRRTSVRDMNGSRKTLQQRNTPRAIGRVAVTQNVVRKTSKGRGITIVPNFFKNSKLRADVEAINSGKFLSGDQTIDADAAGDCLNAIPNFTQLRPSACGRKIRSSSARKSAS